MLKQYEKGGKFLKKFMLSTFGDPETRTSKKCPSCKVVKDLSEYNRSKKQKDKRDGWCRVCKSLRRKARLLKGKKTL